MPTEKRHLNRREFLRYSAIGAGTAALGVAGTEHVLGDHSRVIPGQILGAGHKSGHLLRGASFPPPTRVERTDCVIVGGGIAGLSAAWRLNKHNYKDYVLLELEPEVGGNAVGGQNSVSAYPWGAHYLPLPDEKLTFVRELLQDLNVIKGYDSKGLPIYEEFYLCAAPQERLFAAGQWQDGLFPVIGSSVEDLRQFKSFTDEMARMRDTIGKDGKHAFVIPIDESSQDPLFRSLDQMSMLQYLREHGWTSEPLIWHVDYCCRDDYGCNIGDTSAWAGIHYFASRRGIGSNAEAHSVLTWPEGNHWLVKRLRELVAANIRPNSLAFKIEQAGEDAIVQYFDLKTHQSVHLVAKSIIFAAPRFTAPYILTDLKQNQPRYLGDFTYAPWMVANITLTRPGVERGVATAWDNVLYKSESLGYVVATHQNVEVYRPRKTVWTYYLPLSRESPADARTTALARSHTEWTTLILSDLRNAHSDIDSLVENIDVWLWGHGMIRPTPGFIWGTSRREALAPLENRIFFAHSDMSGISIFEEAQIHGVNAADAAMKLLGKGQS
jgi:hypothetical protein